MWEGLQAVRREIEEAVNTAPDNQEINDGFQLRFVGKSYAKFIAGLPSETMLVPDTDWNNQEGNRDSQNIFITGDNLDALKHLVNVYTGAINMIYIDPPYNTGAENDFVYKDSFNFSDSDLKQKLGFTDTEVARLRALDGKCSHSAWLTFMLPRLILAKQLLADGGMIFISIDDNEQANLKCLCDEIFRENNFIGTFKWNKVAKAPSLTHGIRCKYEYILCYKRGELKKLYGKDSYNSQAPLWHNPNKPQELFFSKGSIRINKNFKKNTKSNKYHVKLLDDLIVENGFNKNPVRIVAASAWSQEKINEYIESGKTFEIKKNIQTMYYDLSSENNFIGPADVINKEECGVDNNTDASDKLKRLGIVFDNPKPVSLIKYLIKMMSYTSKDAIILDFFAGSATTAHAVMQLNKEDGGNRKYIMVQLDELVKTDSEAFKQGFNTIDEISRERIKRAAKQIGDTSGFKHYKLARVSDDLVLHKIDKFDPTMPNLLADDMLSPFSGDALGTGLAASGLDTILTTWMVDDGYAINSAIDEHKFGNCVAHSPAGSRCLYLISGGWDSGATRDLLNKIGRNEISVQTVVIYNHSFDFTTLTELKNNLRAVLDDDKKVEIIERF